MMYLCPKIIIFLLSYASFIIFVLSGHHHWGWNLTHSVLPEYPFPYSKSKAWSLQDVTLAYEFCVWEVLCALKDVWLVCFWLPGATLCASKMSDSEQVIHGFRCSRPRMIPVWKVTPSFVYVAKQIAIPLEKVQKRGSSTQCGGCHHGRFINLFFYCLEVILVRVPQQRCQIQRAWVRGAMGALLDMISSKNWGN